MCGTEPDRKPRSRRALAATAALGLLAGSTFTLPARAGDGLWDAMLETLNIKAAPPPRAPDFIERSRPDPSGLGYIPPAVPHKVSPLPVKSAAQIKAKQDALDAARTRQLDPGAPVPLQIAKAKRPTRPAPAVTD